MQFLALTAVGLFAALSAAQNAFIQPVAGDTFAAGSSTTLEWDPTTNGTVTLRLQWGATTTSSDGVLIASDVDNSGSYLWTVPADIPVESDYFIYIADDDDSSIVNYSARFAITGATGSTTTTSASASATSTSTVASSTASTTTTTSASSTSTSASSSSTSASNSTTLVTTSSSAVVPSSTSAVATKSSSSSTSSSASSSASATSVPDSGVAALKAPVIMLGVFALGAFALL